MLATISAGRVFDIRPIGLIEPIFAGAQAAHESGFFAVLIPERRFPYPQKIAVIFQQFLKAGAGHIHQF
jgi:hypothetical protein